VPLLFMDYLTQRATGDVSQPGEVAQSGPIEWEEVARGHHRVNCKKGAFRLTMMEAQSDNAKKTGRKSSNEPVAPLAGNACACRRVRRQRRNHPCWATDQDLLAHDGRRDRGAAKAVREGGPERGAHDLPLGRGDL